MSIVLDGVADNEPLNLPRVTEGEPVVRLLMLEAIDDGLQSVGRERTMREDERGCRQLETTECIIERIVINTLTCNKWS